ESWPPMAPTLRLLCSNDPPTPAISTLSLHDALPISTHCDVAPAVRLGRRGRGRQRQQRGEQESGAHVHSGSASMEHERQTPVRRSEEHTSELQSRSDLVCRLLLEKKKTRPEP